MDAATLQQLILYIIDQAQDLGGYTTTIRLVKFLYLIDLEHYRRHGRIITDLKWVFYLYGPFAFELPNIGAKLGLDLEREEFTNKQGKRGVLLRVSDLQQFPSNLRPNIKQIIDGLLSVWADRDTAELLEYVYHRTEPMIQARRGEALDFSKVEQGTRFYELYVPVDKSVVRQLREGVRAFMKDDATDYVTPLTWVDNALVKGIEALDDDE